MTTFFSEPLEGRTHFTASNGLDPTYAFGEQDAASRLGHHFEFFQAVPAPGDRTYVLADYYVGKLDHYKTNVGPPTLAIIAVGADGNLDAAFGDGGIALTGRVTQPHAYSPGILKLDPHGRLYFADDSRVMRFRPNGSTDIHFGKHGSITYSNPSQPVALCDIAPTDAGVLIATMKQTRGIESFFVSKATAKGVRRTWAADHNTGLRTHDFDFNGIAFEDVQGFRATQMQFAQSQGGTVLLRIESDQTATTIYDAGDEVGVSEGATRQDVVVTTFDPAGHGGDIARVEMRRQGEDGVSNLGAGPDTSGGPSEPAAVLSPTGRTLLVQTSEEILRLDLRHGTAYRYGFPTSKAWDNYPPTFRLLADNYLYALEDPASLPDVQLLFKISRFHLDGTLDTTFANNGLLTVRYRDFSSGQYQFIDQMFLGASRRFYFYADGAKDDVNGDFLYRTLTVRRV